MASNETEIPNIYAYRARRLVSLYHERNKSIPHHRLSEMIPLLRNPKPKAELPVCIIGAGAAGLYTAMILQSLEIDYQIVDADTRERVGGRLFTHHFPGGGAYDYYDVGAMRFPDTPFMKRTFDLARNRGLKVNLIPYITQMVDPPNTWLVYNNVRVNNQDSSVSGDPFGVRSYVVDQSLTTPEGVSKKVGEILQPFRDLFRPREVPLNSRITFPPSDISAAMDALFLQTNNFSVRSYMFTQNMADQDVSWCETLDKTGTGWYDRSLTQAVVESIAFSWPTTPLPGPEVPKDPNEGWYCFDGGSSTLPRAMFASLPEKVRTNTLFNSRVTAISRVPQTEVMRISINGQPSQQEYSAVISTVPLPRLSFVDLTGVNINDNYAQWSAIRVLQYGSAVKVGMKFSTPWWETELPQTIHGGQSYTDRPVRSVVYPSYPPGAAPADRSKALIVSYCGIQDAERLGAFINRDGTAAPELIDQVFRDLAEIHGVEVSWIKQFYTEGDYFAWDWLRDPLTMGAFAVFGPGVYGNGDVYSEIRMPAARGKLFFAGEAVSACHSWVAGALDSAWHAVNQYLALNHPLSTREKFWKLWGATEYWDEASNADLVQLNNKLAERHLVIGLYRDGVKLESE